MSSTGNLAIFLKQLQRGLQRSKSAHTGSGKNRSTICFGGDLDETLIDWRLDLE
jgi:hypothetical protein